MIWQLISYPNFLPCFFPFLFSQSWNQFSFFSSELMGMMVEMNEEQNVWRRVDQRNVSHHLFLWRETTTNCLHNLGCINITWEGLSKMQILMCGVRPREVHFTQASLVILKLFGPHVDKLCNRSSIFKPSFRQMHCDFRVYLLFVGSCFKAANVSLSSSKQERYLVRLFSKVIKNNV